MASARCRVVVGCRWLHFMWDGAGQVCPVGDGVGREERERGVAAVAWRNPGSSGGCGGFYMARYLGLWGANGRMPWHPYPCPRVGHPRQRARR